MPPFAENISRWNSFYGLAGAASATLAGLLFVAVSLHIDIIALEKAKDARTLARQTLLNFVYAIVISLVFLVPSSMPLSVGLPVFFIGLAGCIQELRIGLKFRQHVSNNYSYVPASYLFRRLLLPIASYAIMFLVSIALLLGITDGLYWMVASIILLLANATLNSWDLLIRLALLKETGKSGKPDDNSVQQ